MRRVPTMFEVMKFAGERYLPTEEEEIRLEHLDRSPGCCLWWRAKTFSTLRVARATAAK